MGCTKSSLTGKFLVINAYIKKHLRLIHNFTPQGTRKRRMRFKFSRRKEITKIRLEINERDQKEKKGNRKESH